MAEFSDEKLLETLERRSQIATDWFKENNMIVNADKFQAIIVKRNSDMCNQYTLNIDGNRAISEKSVKLLGINIDNNLSTNTSRNQLHAISKLHRGLRNRPLIWHFGSAKPVKKIEQIQTRALGILYNDFDSDYKTLLDKSGEYKMEENVLEHWG